jgi:hypothetical protein
LFVFDLKGNKSSRDDAVSKIYVAAIQSKIAIFCTSYRAYNFFIGQFRHSIANTLASILQPGQSSPFQLQIDSLNVFDFESELPFKIKSNPNKVPPCQSLEPLVSNRGVAIGSPICRGAVLQNSKSTS